jgi:ComF family protein
MQMAGTGAMDRQYQNGQPGCQPILWRTVDSLIAAICPWRCVCCNSAANGMEICADCLNDLPWLGNCCSHCGMPLTVTDSLACGGCLAIKNDSHSVDLCIAALSYEFPVDRFITGLKYRHKPEFARVLGDLLAIRIQEESARPDYRLPDAILPVPLHPLRLLQRGFNQSAEIARWVAKTLQLPRAGRLVRRVRNTPAQAGLSRTARLANMHRAFQLTAPVKGMRIALLDDVITTGATITALAELLKRAGVLEVQVWAAARTVD